MSSPEQNKVTLKQVVEAIVFGADHPVTVTELYDVLSQEVFTEHEFELDKLQDVIDELIQEFRTSEKTFEIRKVGGGIQFFTKEQYFPFLRQAQVLKQQKKISRASMETLAIIAYRQPVTKTEIEFIRGVNCDYAVHKLLDKKLVEIIGRSEAPGRPLLYANQSCFL